MNTGSNTESLEKQRASDRKMSPENDEPPRPPTFSSSLKEDYLSNSPVYKKKKKTSKRRDFFDQTFKNTVTMEQYRLEKILSRSSSSVFRYNSSVFEPIKEVPKFQMPKCTPFIEKNLSMRASLGESVTKPIKPVVESSTRNLKNLVPIIRNNSSKKVAFMTRTRVSWRSIYFNFLCIILGTRRRFIFVAGCQTTTHSDCHSESSIISWSYEEFTSEAFRRRNRKSLRAVSGSILSSRGNHWAKDYSHQRVNIESTNGICFTEEFVLQAIEKCERGTSEKVESRIHYSGTSIEGMQSSYSSGNFFFNYFFFKLFIVRLQLNDELGNLEHGESTHGSRNFLHQFLVLQRVFQSG